MRGINVTIVHLHKKYGSYLPAVKIPKFLDKESLVLSYYIIASNELSDIDYVKYDYDMSIATEEETSQHAKYHIEKNRKAPSRASAYNELISYSLKDGVPTGERSVKLVNDITTIITTVAYPVDIIEGIMALNK